MPSKKVDFGTTSAPLLFNIHEHKKGILQSLTIDNMSLSGSPVEVQFLDCFTTDASKIGSTGATQAAENLGTTNKLSGRVRHQQHVHSSGAVTLQKEELEGVEFFGEARAYTPDSAGLVSELAVIVRYKMT